jgi:predicted esterase
VQILAEIDDMPNFPRFRTWPTLALGLLLLAPAGTWAQDNSQRVKFDTADGVELVGTFYPNPGGKRNACVILLHDFDRSKGGNRTKDGWPELASKLQEVGYAVLSFDFRGFGDSKQLRDSFWDLHKNPHNGILHGARAATKPQTLDHKTFPSSYYPHLVNDIMAAKAFLDQKSDQGQVNSASTILIGAGNGASLGVFWMKTQCQLRRDNNTLLVGPRVPANQAECEDIAAGVWLTVNPRLPGKNVSIASWLSDTAAKKEIPMAFVYGKNDENNARLAKTMDDYLKKRTRAKLPLTGAKDIEGTKLTGSQLLHKNLNTVDWIINDYLKPVMEKRGTRLARERKLKETGFLWMDDTGKRILGVAKKPMLEEMIQPVPLNLFGIR